MTGVPGRPPRAEFDHGEIATDLSEFEQLLDDIIVSSRLDPDTARWDEVRPPLRTRAMELTEQLEATTTRFRGNETPPRDPTQVDFAWLFDRQLVRCPAGRRTRLRSSAAKVRWPQPVHHPIPVPYRFRPYLCPYFSVERQVW